jgi:hypothetical protein
MMLDWHWKWHFIITITPMELASSAFDIGKYRASRIEEVTSIHT